MGPAFCWSDVFLSSGKILNTEIIAIRRWKTGWKPTFQREAGHYCRAEPERARLGRSPPTMTSQISAWKEDTALAVVLLSEGENFQPSWSSQPSVRMEREAALHFKWGVWTSEISAAAVRGLGETPAEIRIRMNLFLPSSILILSYFTLILAPFCPCFIALSESPLRIGPFAFPQRLWVFFFFPMIPCSSALSSSLRRLRFFSFSL